MRQWITENNRWFSPKYIAGESLGTTRTVANALEENGKNFYPIKNIKRITTKSFMTNS